MQSRSALGAAGRVFRIKNISKRVQKIVISPIKEMSILADEFIQKTGADVISFGQGIPYFDTPLYIKEGLREALNEIDTAKYTLEPGITELRRLIAKDLQKRKAISSPDGEKEIMVSAGCQEAVVCALATVIDEGDEVLLPSPTFPSQIEQIIQLGGIPVFVPLKENDGWKFDIEGFEKHITEKTKVVIFANPSNPTGTVLSKKEMQDIADMAKRHNLIIIADETYDFLVYDEGEHISFGTFPDIRDCLIVCGSFSKRYAMSGYRVGYAFAEEGIIDHMLKVHDALIICAPAISQKAVVTALQGSQDSVAQFKNIFIKNREVMTKKFDEMKKFLEYQVPKGAYYLFPKITAPHNGSFDLALKILREARVIVIPGAAFGPTGEGHLRFSFAGNPDRIEEGCERLKKWFSK